MKNRLEIREVDEAAIMKTTIRDLIDREPAFLTILGPLGIDLCCGGGHPLGEALDLHGIERSDVMPAVLDLAARGNLTER